MQLYFNYFHLYHCLQNKLVIIDTWKIKLKLKGSPESGSVLRFMDNQNLTLQYKPQIFPGMNTASASDEQLIVVSIVVAGDEIHTAQCIWFEKSLWDLCLFL